ncbi:hypothetical protein AB3S75_046982 [Citrus x aurantiifolia]
MLIVLQELAKKRKKKDVEQIIAICWAVWYARNCSVIEGKKEDPTMTTTRTEAVVESYRRIKGPSAQGQTSHKNSKQKWEPPLADKYKVNVDATIQVSQSKAGLGVVIQNSKGEVVAAAVQKVFFKGDVANMEAEAVIFRIQVAQQINCMPSIIESDCKKVVEFSMGKRSSRTEICWNIEEIQAKLQN